MAPDTPQVMAELEKRFLERHRVVSQKLDAQELRKWSLANAPSPRGIPPSVIESEIAHLGSTGVRVILNEKGSVVTVIPGGL